MRISDWSSDVGSSDLSSSAAKNHDFVAVITDAADYAALTAELDANDGATTSALRRRLAAGAYARTAAYDAAISGWFAEQVGERFPKRIAIAGELRQTLRYGENPHQAAAFYTAPRLTAQPARGIATAEQLQGTELS